MKRTQLRRREPMRRGPSTSRKRIRPRSSRARLRAELYRDAREICLRAAGYRCERCASESSGIECHHVITRRLAALSAHPLNLLALCPDCHRWWHANRDAAKAWFIARFGPERLERLIELRRIATSWRRP